MVHGWVGQWAQRGDEWGAHLMRKCAHTSHAHTQTQAHSHRIIIIHTHTSHNTHTPESNMAPTTTQTIGIRLTSSHISHSHMRGFVGWLTPTHPKTHAWRPRRRTYLITNWQRKMCRTKCRAIGGVFEMEHLRFSHTNSARTHSD